MRRRRRLPFAPMCYLTETPLVLMATKTAPALFPLHVLLVGNKEEDFFLIREILERTQQSLATDLDHAHSLDEAKTMLEEKPYGLVLFEYETGDPTGGNRLGKFLQTEVPLPVIFLTEHPTQHTDA